ncbi:MAG: glycosyltransferase family 1 protein [Rhodothermales bacterium]
MITATRNQYFVCLGRGQSPVPWNPFDLHQQVNVHTDYFGKAFVEMESCLEQEGLVFYLTWDLDALPAYGDHVVAVVLGDEWGRIPRYADKVGALFKCYGFASRPVLNPFHKMSYSRWLTFLKYLYSLVQHVPGWVRYRLNKLRLRQSGKPIPPLYTIPLGYANQGEHPMIPCELRTVDVSFAGSIHHKPYAPWSLNKWFGTPKALARNKMVAALKQMKSAHETWCIDLKITDSFQAVRSASPEEYARRIMNAKISVVPRGNSLETFRFFEAMRAGCILITEELPDFWFYRKAPVIRVNDWRELNQIVADLIADPQLMQRLHAQSIGWWRDVCSSTALGQYMADKINRLHLQTKARNPDRRPMPLRPLQQIQMALKEGVLPKSSAAKNQLSANQ